MGFGNEWIKCFFVKQWKLFMKMFGKGEEMTSCQLEKNSATRTIVKLHRVRWKIENVSMLCEGSKIKGPELFFMNTCLCYMALKKFRNALEINIYNKLKEDLRINNCKLVLLDCEGSKLKEVKYETTTLQNGGHFYAFLNIQGLDSLKDNILEIDCCLKVMGRVTTETVGSFKSISRYQAKLLKSLKSMFNNPDGSDFTLQVGDNLIYAHKNVLSFRSEYFKCMFESNMKENVQGFVVVEDVLYSTMKKLVEFLYTGKFTMVGENDQIQEFWNLYVAADKYQVTDLKTLCADKLISSATEEDTPVILDLAKRYSDKYLECEAMKTLKFQFD